MTRTDAQRFAGLAGVTGGVGWAALSVLTVAGEQGLTPLWYGPLDVLTPVALALSAVGLAGHLAATRSAWGRLATAGFLALAAGVLGALAGSAAYVLLGALDGWALSVWAYALALVGATAFGVGLLRGDAAPRTGAALLAALPVGLAASVALAAAVGDETVVSLVPGVQFGSGIAALGRWLFGAAE